MRCTPQIHSIINAMCMYGVAQPQSQVHPIGQLTANPTNMDRAVRGVYLVGLTTTYTAYATSNVVLATLGYTYTSEGFNDGFSKVVYTDKTQVTITAETTTAYLWYDATVVTSITCGAATITPNAVSGLSANTIQGIEIVQLLAAGGVSASTNITFVKAGDDIVIPLNFVCENKYGQQDVLFLNKYGV